MKQIDNFLLSKGNSMYPLLLDNDIIILKPARKIAIDDIVAIGKKSYYLTHRIIYIDKSKKLLIAKGDNNLVPDKPISLKKIAGKVEEVIRTGKALRIEKLYLFQSTFYFNEIKKINSHFLKQSIPFVFLKGLPIYLYYTKRCPRRIYADCDILIDNSNKEEVDQLFSSLGYQKQVVSPNPILDVFTKNKAEVTYWKFVNNFRIDFDIHFEAVFFFVQTNNLSPLYPKNLVTKFSQHLLSHKQSQLIEKTSYPFLSTEAQIVYLAIHLFHDNFKGYYKYTILEKVINSGKFKESDVIELIKNYHLENFVFPVFSLLKKYYQPKLSKNFLKKIAPDKQKLKAINYIVKSTNIFEDERRGGAKRFKNIYNLSSTNSLLKPLIFLKPTIFVLISFDILKRFLMLIRYFYPLVKRRLLQLTKKITPQQAAVNQNPTSH